MSCDVSSTPAAQRRQHSSFPNMNHSITSCKVNQKLSDASGMHDIDMTEQSAVAVAPPILRQIGTTCDTLPHLHLTLRQDLDQQYTLRLSNQYTRIPFFLIRCLPCSIAPCCSTLHTHISHMISAQEARLYISRTGGSASKKVFKRGRSFLFLSH